MAFLIHITIRKEMMIMDERLEQIERYLRTQNNEDLCNDSVDLIDFIETVRDDELIRRMEQADDK